MSKKEKRQRLKDVSGVRKKVCGNCCYHNAYEYPDKVFCFVKFQKLANPVVSVLDHCGYWENKPQECNCLEDALKKNKKKT